jgi:hypothetical protein
MAAAAAVAAAVAGLASRLVAALEIDPCRPTVSRVPAEGGMSALMRRTLGENRADATPSAADEAEGDALADAWAWRNDVTVVTACLRRGSLLTSGSSAL